MARAGASLAMVRRGGLNAGARTGLLHLAAPISMVGTHSMRFPAPGFGAKVRAAWTVLTWSGIAAAMQVEVVANAAPLDHEILVGQLRWA